MDKESLLDEELLQIAQERMEHFDPDKTISDEEIMERFGITEDDLEGYESVEIE